MPGSPRTTLPVACIAVLLAACRISYAQQPTPAAAPQPTIPSSSIVQPAMTEVERSISALNISRWKAPGQVKSAAQQDTGSIQRDLSDTLPGLLSKADAAPTTVPPAFVVYRNIDALYDVLLRVSETASWRRPRVSPTRSSHRSTSWRPPDRSLVTRFSTPPSNAKTRSSNLRPRCAPQRLHRLRRLRQRPRWSTMEPPHLHQPRKRKSPLPSPGRQSSRRSDRLNLLKYVVFRETILRQPVSKKDRVSETLGRRRQSCPRPLAGYAFCLLL